VFTSADPTVGTPGALTLSRTIAVTYDPSHGSYQPDLRFYVANAAYTGGGIDAGKWLHVTIQRIDGAPSAPVYDGTVADLANNHGQWAPIDLTWTPGTRDTRTFRITVSLDTPLHNTLAGTATVDFRWFDMRNQCASLPVLTTANVGDTGSYQPPA